MSGIALKILRYFRTVLQLRLEAATDSVAYSAIKVYTKLHTHTRKQSFKLRMRFDSSAAINIFASLRDKDQPRGLS